MTPQFEPLFRERREQGIALHGSFHPQALHRRRHRVGEKHWIDPLQDVPRNFEEVTLVFEWNQHPAGAVFHDQHQGCGIRFDPVRIIVPGAQLDLAGGVLDGEEIRGIREAGRP